MSHEIVKNLQRLAGNAYTPVCHFAFRCAIESMNGRVFYGVNWELPDFRIGCCAEVSALAEMISQEGASLISNVWLMADEEADEQVRNNCPCGVCRQHLMEYTTPQTALHLVSPSGRVVESLPLANLMPRPFSYRSYIPRVEALLADSLATKKPVFDVRNSIPDERHIRDYMSDLLGRSFCPALQRHEACVLVMESGRYIGGNSFSTASLKGSNSAVKSAISRKFTSFGKEVVKQVYSSLDLQSLSGEDKDILSYMNITDVHQIRLES